MPNEVTTKYTLITDGTKLVGAAMPKILAEFQVAVIGKKIVNAGYITTGGECWPVLLLEDGENITIQSDDEGNGPGTPITSKGKCLCSTQAK